MRLNEEDEVVISNHVYNYFKHFGYIYEYNNLSDKISARDMTPEKLIGKILNIHINEQHIILKYPELSILILILIAMIN